jgi:drug/metabolite transporter (DMT)-like permease
VLLLSVVQFVVSAMLNIIAALFTEEMSIHSIEKAAVPLLYGGIMSIGVAYTLQVVAQRNVSPSQAAIVLSLESVFAMLGGYLLLDEAVTLKKAIGGMLMLAGLVISQLEPEKKKEKI